MTEASHLRGGQPEAQDIGQGQESGRLQGRGASQARALRDLHRGEKLEPADLVALPLQAPDQPGDRIGPVEGRLIQAVERERRFAPGR